MPHINLDEKSPQELRMLLDTVKTSNLDYREKEEWIQRIQEGQADIDDINS